MKNILYHRGHPDFSALENSSCRQLLAAQLWNAQNDSKGEHIVQ